MSALDIQIGGEHYKNAKIQPIQYIEANDLGFLEGCVVKRITRHDKPTGKGRQDIEKAIHELQLLLESRYQQAPSTAERGSLFSGPVIHPVTNPPGEDIYAEFAARMGTVPGREAPTKCEECNAVSRGGRTHVATCSQLTAPEEYKAEAQVAFDEATELSDALARQVSAGKIDTDFDELESAMVAVGEKMMAKHCPTCGAAEGAFHKPDCTVMRRGKSRLAAAYAESRAAAKHEEPAAAMDDDSPRMQAIGQNGNDGEHYDDPFAGAPDWAKYKAQDEDGEWRWYARRPVAQPAFGYWVVSKGRIDVGSSGEPNPDWRDTLITRT